ncbi:MAG: MerR family transcriptional regulator [Sulfuricurvum sp.]
MEYKMSELCELGNVSKSTVLYYIKEGLLPEARKIKSNVHRYNDEHLELIRYIKYMQQEMGSSIEQIKGVLKHKNQSFSSSFSMVSSLMQTLSGVSEETPRLSKSEFIKKYDFDHELIDHLLETKILLPIGEDVFTDKEAAIVHVVQRFKELNVEITLLEKYAECAHSLSQYEYELQQALCQKRTDENFHMLWQMMLDTLFNARIYIFNRSIHNSLTDVLKKELSTKSVD